MSTTKLAEALHDLRIAVIAHYGASRPETAIGQCLDEAAAALASYEAEAKPADECEAFEAWAGKQIGLSTDGRVNYVYGATRDAWTAWQARAALEAKPAPADLCERICAAIVAEDTKSVDEAGYMLDSNDCCRIVREQFAAAPAAPAPEPLTDAKLFKIAQSMPQRPWGIGSRHCDAIAYARAAIAASKGGAE